MRRISTRPADVEAPRGRAPRRAALAAVDRAARARAVLQRGLHALDGGRVDQRADERAGLARVADRDGA